MGRRGTRYFSKRAPKFNNDTNSNPMNVCGEETSNDRDAHNTEWAGFIFMCDESTKMDCFKYRVLGLSEEKKHLTDFITKGMSLFLFDVKLRIMYGIYAASSCGAFQLEPDAFGGDYPWQVKFHIEKDCLPLSEDVFKPAIKDNYFTLRKFSTKLTAEQVQKLVKLFSPLPGGPIQHPSINISDGCDASGINTASVKETGRCIEDRHTQGHLPPSSTDVAHKPDEFIQSDSLPRFNHEATHPSNDEVKAEKSVCDYNHSPKSKHPTPFVPACEKKLIDGCIRSDPHPMLKHKLPHPLDDAVMSRKCMHGYHEPCANHGFLPTTSPFEAKKADGFDQGHPLPCLYYETSHLFNDSVMSEKCMHDYHAPKSKHFLLPPMPPCKGKLIGSIQSGSFSRSCHKPTHPLSNVVVTEMCMHGCHAPRAKHAFLPPAPVCEDGMTKEFIESELHPKLNCDLLSDAVMAERCMHGYWAHTAKYKQICVAHDPPLLAKQCKVECGISSHVNGMPILHRCKDRSHVNDEYPCYPQHGHICGNSAAHVNSSIYKHSHPMAAAIQGSDRNLHEGEPLVDSSICRHAEIAPQSPDNAGIFNAFPGHYSKGIRHKRRFQEICVRALRDAPGSVPTTSGESKCNCF